MEKELKIAVLGGGSWGTAVTNYLAKKCGPIKRVLSNVIIKTIKKTRNNRQS